MLHLFTLWFWYLIAFGAGAAAMWFALPRLVPARTPAEALGHAGDPLSDDAFDEREDAR